MSSIIAGHWTDTELIKHNSESHGYTVEYSSYWFMISLLTDRRFVALVLEYKSGTSVIPLYQSSTSPCTMLIGNSTNFHRSRLKAEQACRQERQRQSIVRLNANYTPKEPQTGV